MLWLEALETSGGVRLHGMSGRTWNLGATGSSSANHHWLVPFGPTAFLYSCLAFIGATHEKRWFSLCLGVEERQE